LANEVQPLTDADDSAKSHAKIKETGYQWWLGFVAYAKREYHQHRTKKKKETPADRATKWTTRATIWIAIFTTVLAGVGYFQWKEMDESGAQTDRMIRLYRSQVGQLSKQAGDTHDLAVAAKAQSDQTKTIAKQAIVQAMAAKSAAQTAKQALHVSERAYIVVGLPTVDTTAKYITLPIVNTGHIPSGKVTGIVHEATIDGVDPTVRGEVIMATESHWKSYEFASVPTTGQTMNFNVRVPTLDADSLNAGHQQILVVGVITYQDGFPDDPEQRWPFCEGSATFPPRGLQWVICDPNLYLPEAIKADQYPSNEYQAN
jgi:hypothetical protein